MVRTSNDEDQNGIDTLRKQLATGLTAMMPASYRVHATVLVESCSTSKHGIGA